MSDQIDASPKSSTFSTKREDVGEREVSCFYEVRVTRRLPMSSSLREARVALIAMRAEALAEMVGLVRKSGGEGE